MKRLFYLLVLVAFGTMANAQEVTNQHEHQNGNTSTVITKENGDKTAKYIRTVDEEGNVVRKTKGVSNEEGGKRVKTRKYDEEGNLVRKSKAGKGKDGGKAYKTRKYNEDGSVQGKNVRERKNGSKRKVVGKKNPDGSKRGAAVQRNKDGKVVGARKGKKDANGNKRVVTKRRN